MKVTVESTTAFPEPESGVTVEAMAGMIYYGVNNHDNQACDI